jgi:transcriptional regulator of arginine metabolism
VIRLERSTSSKERSRRQELILELISRRDIHTQRQLLEELGRRRVTLTQATLSRELKELGVAKGPDGRGGYRYLAGTATGEGPLQPVASFIRDTSRARNLLVVKTPPGNAQGVARGLDQVDWPEVLGTIAGDDTILLVCRTERDAGRVEKRLKLIARL